jgi:hypothetical protein
MDSFDSFFFSCILTATELLFKQSFLSMCSILFKDILLSNRIFLGLGSISS